MRIRVSALLVSVCVALLATSASATITSTSPGRKSVFLAASGEPCSLDTEIDLTGVIESGLRNHVLAIDVSVQMNTSFDNGNNLYAELTVNGFTDVLKPTPSIADTRDCTLCGISFTLWVDLDKAESLHPGQFIRQPLSINVFATAGQVSYNGNLCDVSLRAYLQKK